MEYVTDERNNALKAEPPYEYIASSGRKVGMRLNFIEGGVIVYCSFKRRGPRGGLKSFFAVRGPKWRAEEVKEILLKTMDGRKYC